MDFTTTIGITLGVCCILLGQTLEGGHVSSIVQLIRGIRQSRYIFITDDVKPEQLMNRRPGPEAVPGSSLSQSTPPRRQGSAAAPVEQDPGRGLVQL